MPRGLFIQFLKRNGIGCHKADDLGRHVVVRPIIGRILCNRPFAAMSIVGCQAQGVIQPVVTIDIRIRTAIPGSESEIKIGIVPFQIVAPTAKQNNKAIVFNVFISIRF